LNGFIKPIAFYVLSDEEKKLQILFALKTPTSCVKFEVLSSKRWGIEGAEITRLSHHDARFITLCMQHFMAKGCKLAIIHLFCVFKKLCAKILDSVMMGELKKDATLMLVLLEQEFPPSFFDIMTHLLVHFVEQLKICGPVHT